MVLFLNKVLSTQFCCKGNIKSRFNNLVAPFFYDYMG
jgi:hypothetical protein